jgi:Transposase and inactivated derivatives
VSDMQKNVTPGRREGCLNYSPEFKQQLVAASCEPGISISKQALTTDMRNGFNGLSAKVQTALKDDPMFGHVFIFQGRSGRPSHRLPCLHLPGSQRQTISSLTIILFSLL